MCGIVGYIGKRHQAKDVLTGGLKKLEYRGYDSAGIAFFDGSKMIYKRAVGEVKNLEKKLSEKTNTGGLEIGIAHTRWATHGKPVVKNAHPHKAGSIYVVHNGIIENYQELRNELKKQGRKFLSDTDSEVLAHLIDEEYGKGNTLAQAVKLALSQVRGAYALVAMSSDEPDELVLARMSSPILLGVADDEFIIASDASAIVEYTKRVVYLDDGDIASVRADGYSIVKGVKKEENTLDWDEEEARLSGFPHFMLKEIYEQPDVVKNAMRGRVDFKNALVKLGGIENVIDELLNARRIIITSCGTSFNAGLIGEYLIENLAGIAVEVDVASEFRYRNAPLGKGDVLLAISQSGETADTLAAVREAKKHGCLTLGIVNVVGSTIARETDAGIYNHAGPEVSVASTKAFSSQLTILTLLAIMLARGNGRLSKKRAIELLKDLDNIPKRIESFLFSSEKTIEKIAKKYAKYDNILYIGRNYQMPLALEGALKIKEIAYIHAEGYPAGEMKHGPIALIDKDMPVCVFAPSDSTYEKTLGAVEEIRARGGRVLAITDKHAKELAKQADDVILIPDSREELAPLLTILPAQLLAYFAAIARKHNVDRPRNLAKSVTVE